MGGVDRLDQNIATYRISGRTKKWWWFIFSFLLSATVNNAWLLYRETDSYSVDITVIFVEFMRCTVNAYLQMHGNRSSPKLKEVRSIPQSKRVLEEVRF